MLAKKFCHIGLLVCLLLIAVTFRMPSHASADVTPGVTIDTPTDGVQLVKGVTRFSGTYTGAYEVMLYINGEKQVNTVMIDPEGDDTGTWYYDFDASSYNGDVQVLAKASNIISRYAVWSPTIHVNVNNPEAGLPQVTVINPADGGNISGTVPIRISATSAETIQSVQVRINNGAWLNTVLNGNKYVYNWKPDGIGDKTVSIEAKASDTKGNVGFSMTTYAKVGAGTNEPFHMSRQDRAMWIWEPETYKLLLNPNSRQVLDALAQDTATFGSDKITTFYLAVGSFAGMDILEDDPGKLRDFVAWAHQHGYEVQACIAGGTSPPYLGAYETYHNKAIREIEHIINYNLAAGANERFDGVNVDIEPYISAEFNSKKPSLQIQYLEGIQKMKNRIQTAGINLPFGPAIPKWYDSSDNSKDITWKGSTKWLSQHVQDISDYIAIMDYRDTADGGAGIMAGAQGEIDYANSINKPNSVVIGVETKDIANSGDPETITFQEEGRAVLEAELDKVYTAFNDDASFGGIAMHHYDDIRKLPSFWGAGGVFWEPPTDTEPPGAVSGTPSAMALDYQQIRISFGMAMDNSEIDRYIVYRSTQSGFTPGPEYVAGLARSLSYNDVGLLQNTTYYYKVAAMDMQGNIGQASAQASAKTGSTTLKPMIVTGLHVTGGTGNSAARMKVVDKATSQAIGGAAVEGRFHFAGGKYVSGTADGSGTISFTSESIPNGQQSGFEPRRVTAPGYYWAQAYDQPHMTAMYPQVGLSGLTMSTGSLSPAFSTNQASYTVSVPNGVSSLQITPTALVNGSAITVNGQKVASGSASQSIALNEGETTISIVVTGNTGVTDSYSVKVTRSVYVNNVFTVTADTYVHQNFPTTNYGSETALEVVDVPSSAGGGDRISFIKFDFGAYAEPVQTAKLNFYVSEATSGTNNVEIYVYDGDTWVENTMNWNNRLIGGATKLTTSNINHTGWYSVDVKNFVEAQMALDKKASFRFLPLSPNVVKINSRENAENQPYIVVNSSSNTNLRSLALNDTLVSQGLDGMYDTVVTNVVDAVTVTPVADEPHAQVAVNGTLMASGQSSSAIPLNVGLNTITIQVTSQNGAIQAYTVHVTRQLPGMTDLHALFLSAGTLTPAFHADEQYYSSTVTNNVYEITVTPVLEDPLATVTVNGTAAMNGAASQAIPLHVGANEVSLVVTGQNGDTQTYGITVTRLPSTNASLNSLAISSGMLTPAFQKNVMRYEATVANSVNAITVTQSAYESLSIVTINGDIVASGAASTAIPLKIGVNTITVAVMAPNGIDHAEYEIQVTRQDEEQHGSSGSAPGTRTAQATSGEKAVRIEIVRTVGLNGAKVDAIILNPSIAKQVLAAAMANTGRTVRINLDTNASDQPNEYEISVNPAFMEELINKQIKLEISSANARIELSVDALAGLKKASQDAIFRMKSLAGEGGNKEAALHVINAGAKVIGQPMDIETNYSGHKTKLYFPITDAGLDLSVSGHTLAVYIEHSDGERLLQEGNVETDANGRPIGIQIEVEKFSTFTLVQLPKLLSQPLPRYVFGYEDGTFFAGEHHGSYHLERRSCRSLGLRTY
ncbi:cadherin-like beta sandwich domain-containing protein [Paenibacillus sp. Soil766]|uniref:cadherin-like beta sandwich domain-containing protein n=1 Tax=Paenibacillus sp. Soil766 TaxID=1736404 RepID=UPI0012FB0A5F|nr:cadherin-like beta sandwich domain-containing protein [Paenibacillus sp. Soil766]